MAKKTILERTEERIAQLQEDKSAEIAQHTERIRSAKEQIAEAQLRMEKAEAAGNLEEYKAAKHEVFDLETEIEFSTNRINRLNHKSLVDATESKRVYQDLLEEEKAAQAEDEATVIGLIAQLESVGVRNKRRKERFNKVQDIWNKEICKDSGRNQDNNSKVWVFVERCINDNQYRQIAGEPIGTAHRFL